MWLSDPALSSIRFHSSSLTSGCRHNHSASFPSSGKFFLSSFPVSSHSTPIFQRPPEPLRELPGASRALRYIAIPPSLKPLLKAIRGLYRGAHSFIRSHSSSLTSGCCHSQSTIALSAGNRFLLSSPVSSQSTPTSSAAASFSAAFRFT